MVHLSKTGFFLFNNALIVEDNDNINLSKINESLGSKGFRKLDKIPSASDAKNNTIARKILSAHNTVKDEKNLKIRFDSLVSHDITYVGIIQTARASGLKEFPVPYALTNCHNSLCAVGGTINEDDHMFGLSAAKKYGGIYVPAHQAVIHQFAREMMAGCGRMILGSDSHTRYGALGTMGIGEGGPEIVKQLLSRTYDIAFPEVIAIYLEGSPARGVGPQDVALAIIRAVFGNGFVKNRIMEFTGPGIENLSIDYRNGIDVMTTETTCLSSIWITDDKVREYYRIHNREEDFEILAPGDIAYYDGLVRVDLSKIEPMIALPFHPANAYPIHEVNKNPEYYFDKIQEEIKTIIESKDATFSLKSKIEKGKIKIDQGIIAGCAGGTFENIVEAAEIMKKSAIGSDQFTMSIYPASQPVFSELVKNGSIETLMNTGAIVKTAFCGPCFGAGDTPSNEGFSIRHATRNFPNREGSKPNQGQLSFVALMDARSIAATAANKGILTSATDIDYDVKKVSYHFNDSIYKNRVYEGFKKADTDIELKFGPNIIDWPAMIGLTENILLKIACVINDSVTTTDELIPSGETSSYRSNPLKLAEFTLSRKVPSYVAKAKETQALESLRRDGKNDARALADVNRILSENDLTLENTGIGSIIAARKPGDGSAREQAASCQKVLGGWANIAIEYATKRYRSNLVNWGMLPFVIDPDVFANLETDSFVLVKGIKSAIEEERTVINATLIGSQGKKDITLKLPDITEDERRIILKGCLINYYKV